MHLTRCTSGGSRPPPPPTPIQILFDLISILTKNSQNRGMVSSLAKVNKLLHGILDTIKSVDSRNVLTNYLNNNFSFFLVFLGKYY